MERVGGDTMVGEIGTLQISKVFCVTRGWSGVNGRKLIGYKDYVLFSCLLGIFVSGLHKFFLCTVLTE